MKTIKLTLAVGLDKLADIIDVIKRMDIPATLGGDDIISATPAMDADDDDDVDVDEVPAAVAVSRRAATVKPVTRAAGVGGNRGPVVYTPVGTQRQIDATMAKLTKGTMSAFVLADLAKHPQSRKRDMLARLAKPVAKAGLSLDSVDNTVWLLQRKGIVRAVPVSDVQRAAQARA